MTGNDRTPTRPSADGMSRTLGECPPGRDPAQFSPVLESRIVAMRALLGRMRPQSDAEALQALRSAFPDASLADRVAALSHR
ncbi:hypothetical protein EYW49_01635 [Siculibacillus lacustris]|uniref:Uncharacterized protein n=1 Tax=Siculibacillus lacustris TaxID=1549641 RepID=A0A4Q9VWY9_9HYPH|nr:hypothetical protein [Siculibacillus lacustris]TBW40880.1 hypothetical protein EYW49_01635 [Siculibacillus lacustris]